MNSARSIVLIGMMGAGKSSVGRALQRQSELQLFDIDEMIEIEFGASIAEIFATHGEEKFRDAETQALRDLVLDRSATGWIRRGEQSIVVAGGGIVLREENIDLLKRLGMVVWLDADEETLFGRASGKGNRPLLQTQNPEKIFGEMLEGRRPLYAKVADVRIDTSGRTDEEVAVMILQAAGITQLFGTKGGGSSKSGATPHGKSVSKRKALKARIKYDDD